MVKYIMSKWKYKWGGKSILDKELKRPLKKAKTFDEQVDILEKRKLVIDEKLITID